MTQQTTVEGMILPIGHIVRHSFDNSTKLCSIIDNWNKLGGKPESKIRVLNSNDTAIVPNESMVSILEPDLSDVLNNPSNTDPKALTNIMNQEAIKTVWKRSDSDFPPSKRLFYQ
jgi:hypothetical protein